MQQISSLYIHFPFCRHLCNYCDFYKHKLVSENQIIEFEKLLLNQVKFHSNFLKQNNTELGKLDTLYIGGGTPSLWQESGVNFLQNLASSGVLNIGENCEFTIEVDPDTWTEKEIDKWINLGVNRFSVGSQAFSEKYIKIMDRTHLLSDVEKTIKYFSERGLNFSVDLMLGLPNSETRDISKEIERLLKYNPKHISVYILKARKSYPLKSQIPNDEFIRVEYLKVSETLIDNGYNHYEISNFSKPGYESRHNKKYWSYNSVAALGPNATGLIVSDQKALRYKWKSISIGLEKEHLAGDSLIIEKLFLGLRSKNDFNLKNLFKKNDENKLIKIVDQWKESKYLDNNSTSEKINLTPLGYLMCDSLINDVFKQIDF